MVKIASRETISFKPAEAIKKLLADLPERAQQIIKKRYGLNIAEPLTLQAIGDIYGITRERVRQIEEFTLAAIRRSRAFAGLNSVFGELRAAMEEHGGIVHEGEFLNALTEDPVTKNQAHFLLVLGEPFIRLKEDEIFHHRWTADTELASAVQGSLENLCRQLSEEDLLNEEELVEMFLKNRDQRISPEVARERARKWLSLCKKIGKNPVGKWGLSHSPQVRVRGIKDYAFLLLRQEGKPMHFAEIAKKIAEIFNRKVNIATTHNELIKDKRFVLVGRGIYALAEWGYAPGVVREVIERLLQKNGPMAQQAIVEAVLKDRQVKPATVLVNLKNSRYFKQVEKGVYRLA